MDKKTEVNVINTILMELYGYEASIPLRSVVASSPRFNTLLAIASHESEDQVNRLRKALPKFVKNPKTRCAV